MLQPSLRARGRSSTRRAPKARRAASQSVPTRQNIQLRGVTLADGPGVIDGLHALNQTCIQTGFDNIRNMVGNPLAGIDEHEMVDTRPFCNMLTDMVTLDTTTGERGNPEYCNLGRKFNICVSGNRDDFASMAAVSSPACFWRMAHSFAFASQSIFTSASVFSSAASTSFVSVKEVSALESSSSVVDLVKVASPSCFLFTLISSSKPCLSIAKA